MKIKLFESCPLFWGIKEEALAKLLSCLGAKEKQYDKGETVISAGTETSRFGVLLSGAVDVLQEDFQGNTTIVAQIAPGELFGEAFASAGIPLPVTVQASEISAVLWLDFRKLVSSCQSNCSCHGAAIKNMMEILAYKNIFLNRRIGHLSKRTLREKILSYLDEQSKQKHSRSFTIPFSRQKMADYLAADRSALSSVLSKLRDDGIIDFQKNQFTLK